MRKKAQWLPCLVVDSLSRTAADKDDFLDFFLYYSKAAVVCCRSSAAVWPVWHGEQMFATAHDPLSLVQVFCYYNQEFSKNFLYNKRPNPAFLILTII